MSYLNGLPFAILYSVFQRSDLYCRLAVALRTYCTRQKSFSDFMNLDESAICLGVTYMSFCLIVIFHILSPRDFGRSVEVRASPSALGHHTNRSNRCDVVAESKGQSHWLTSLQCSLNLLEMFAIHSPVQLMEAFDSSAPSATCKLAGIPNRSENSKIVTV